MRNGLYPPWLLWIWLGIAVALMTCVSLHGQPPSMEAASEPIGSVASPSAEALSQDESTRTPATEELELEEIRQPWITNDAVLTGVLMVLLGGIFWTSKYGGPGWQLFYRFVPMLLLCYFLPSLLTFFGIVDPEQSQLYFVASRYFLPASLVLLTISIDLNEVLKLGPKAGIMFLTGSLGVIFGGPFAMLVVSWFNPDLVGGTGENAVWRGLATIAGSWIGGNANQVAMKEMFTPSNELYSVMIAIDVIVAQIWMGLLLLGVGNADRIDRFFRADASSIERLKAKMEAFSLGVAQIPTTADLMSLMSVAFGATGVSHVVAEYLAPWFHQNYPQLDDFGLDEPFFWLIVTATTIGVGLSFTSVRNLEGVGASKMGTLFIYFLVATIGLKMDIHAVFKHPGLFLVGGVWMLFHVSLMLVVAYLIKAPFFFLAVGSKANIGGAASAPVVAAAFHPSLAPVGVLLAVLGYALGTYGAMLCAWSMRLVAP